MKKYLIFIFLALLSLLTACGSKYKENAYFEVEKLSKTNHKELLGSQYKNIEVNELFSKSLIDFSYETASGLLEERNGMYSPVSFYIALSELAELTGSYTQREVLDALKINDINILRDGNLNLYKKLSYENKISTLKIGNSIWLNNSYIYKDFPLETLRNKYYASSYGIDFSKEDNKKMICQWVSDNTGGKLGNDDFNNLRSDTIFVLLNTIYFYDEWVSKFDKNLNYKDSFYGIDDDVEYMKQQLQGFYFSNEEYEASYLNFKNGLRISFAMPKESTKLVDFMRDPNKIKELLNDKNLDPCLVNYNIPKFNYKSSFDLKNYARSLGINSVFDIADFSPLTDTSLFVSAMYQKSFIQIDETGGKAAAFTAINGVKSAAPSDEVTFNLNKPFIYAIYSGDYPLFIGVVTNPGSTVEEKYL